MGAWIEITRIPRGWYGAEFWAQDTFCWLCVPPPHPTSPVLQYKLLCDSFHIGCFTNGVTYLPKTSGLTVAEARGRSSLRSPGDAPLCLLTSTTSTSYSSHEYVKQPLTGDLMFHSYAPPISVQAQILKISHLISNRIHPPIHKWQITGPSHLHGQFSPQTTSFLWSLSSLTLEMYFLKSKFIWNLSS